MRKNRMMRAASALLVAVLMTTCTISGTFAKYTTEISAQDSARVAYWGFGNNNTLAFNLFTTDGVNLSSNDGIIAPGTSGSTNIKFAFDNGKTAPEVAYTFTVDANITISDTAKTALDANDNFYWVFNGTAYKTVDTLISAIEALSSAATVNAGQLPPNMNVNQEYMIGWMWLFNETSTIPTGFPDTFNGNPIVPGNTDTEDTAMGDANYSDITVVITITATQVD